MSLAQLPPPIENENDEKEDFCLPPPPEFNESQAAALLPSDELVVAPPPQFSDNRQVTRVKLQRKSLFSTNSKVFFSGENSRGSP